jgi:hypothetical protein
MWQKGLTCSRDGSTSLSAFAETSEFLSQNLGQNESALVPMRDVFYVMNPELRGKLVDYWSIWNSAGVILQANTPKEEMLKVRSYFVEFLKENLQIKYIVRDWVDSYAKHLYEAMVADELMVLLSEVKTIPFTLSTGWSSSITIYEKVQYTNLFAINSSSPPKQFFTIPSNATIQFGSNGTTIQKAGQRVGFYLPLDTKINATKQHHLTMQIELNIENVRLLIVFYYDKNRDGVFSGYEIDYVKSAGFNQTQLNWVTREWYKIYQVIPKADDPVVQIGIIMEGNKPGTITLADLVVYTKMTSEV